MTLFDFLLLLYYVFIHNWHIWIVAMFVNTLLFLRHYREAND